MQEQRKVAYSLDEETINRYNSI